MSRYRRCSLSLSLLHVFVPGHSGATCGFSGEEWRRLDSLCPHKSAAGTRPSRGVFWRYPPPAETPAVRLDCWKWKLL